MRLAAGATSEINQSVRVSGIGQREAEKIGAFYLGRAQIVTSPPMYRKDTVVRKGKYST